MKPFLAENRRLLLLTIPLIANYFVEGCPGFINNAMIAHLSQQALAAGAIVSTAFTSLLLFFYGVFNAVATLISHHSGAKAIKPVGEVVKDASLLAVIFSVILLILMAFGPTLLHLAGQPEAIIILAKPYIHGLMFAVVPDFMSMVFWQFFLGLGKPKITLVSSLLYVPISIGANYVLMFGHLGFPALGMLGIGLGTAVGFWLLTLGQIIYIIYHPEYRRYFSGWFTSLGGKHLKPLMKVGLPMGVMFTIDLSFIAIVAFMVGHINITLLAAQQIGLQALSLVMITIAGLTQAISIRLGHTWGAKAYGDAPMIGLTGFIHSFVLALLCALIFWIKPMWIIGIDFNLYDANNALVIQLATGVLMVMGFYLLANSLRYAAFALLRALKDTHFPAACSFFGFYGVTLGIGYPLLFHWHGSLIQFWCLATASTFFMATAMVWRFMLKIR